MLNLKCGEIMMCSSDTIFQKRGHVIHGTEQKKVLASNGWRAKNRDAATCSKKYIFPRTGQQLRLWIAVCPLPVMTGHRIICARSARLKILSSGREKK
jgi:hypothetical protein